MQETNFHAYSTVGFMDKCQRMRQCHEQSDLHHEYKCILDDLAFRCEIADITEREYRLFCYWASLVYDDVITEIHFHKLFGEPDVER